MAATEDFDKPAWANPIDTDLDAIRNNQNYLLTLAVAGSGVAPDWQTGVDISTSGTYAQPDAINLSRGTREIAINIVWA